MSELLSLDLVSLDLELVGLKMPLLAGLKLPLLVGL